MTGMNGEKSSEVAVRWQPGCLVDALDRRTSLYRRVRERMDAIAADLGGWDGLSAAQTMLIERSVWLEHWLQAQEAKLAETPQEFDVRAYTQATYALTATVVRLGLKRQARDLPHPLDYARQREQEAGR